MLQSIPSAMYRFLITATLIPESCIFLSYLFVHMTGDPLSNNVLSATAFRAISVLVLMTDYEWVDLNFL